MFNKTAIRKYIDVSTGHILQKDAESLQDPKTFPGVAYDYEYGAWVHVPIDDTEDQLSHYVDFGSSPEFINILREAAKQGIGWVRFDSDGEVHENFPTFEW